MKTSFPTLVVALVLAALVISCAAPAPTPTAVPKPTATEPSRITPLPPPTPTASGPLSADAIMSSQCTGCHTLERVVSSKKTRAQWEQSVVRMVPRMAAAEQTALLDYLAATYKP